MITYELALKLKDAGFPQKVNKTYREEDCFIDAIGRGYPKTGAIGVYIPILSELIDACGTSLECLKQYSDGTWACGFYIEGEWNGESEGSTPEAAVANLYLAINKIK